MLYVGPDSLPSVKRNSLFPRTKPPQNTPMPALGSSTTVVTLHKDRLSAACNFFSATFNSNFREGSEQEMDPLAERPDIIEMLAKWFYHGAVTLYVFGGRASAAGFQDLLDLLRLPITFRLIS